MPTDPPAPPPLAARILDSLPGRVVAVGPDRRYLHANQAYLDWVNRTPEQVIGRPVAEVIGIDVAAAIEPFLLRCFAGAARAEWEGWAQLHGLRPRYLRQTFFPCGDAGAVTAAVVVSEDLPAPVEIPPRTGPAPSPAAMALAGPDLPMLRTVLDEVPARTVIVSLDDRFLYCNREFAEFFRVTPEDVVGRSIAEVIGEAAWRTMEPWKVRLVAGQSIRNEGWMTYPGGRRVFIQQHVIPHRGADGQVVAFVSMSLDLTALRLREAEIEDQAAALRASESMNAAIIASGLDGIVVVDEGGKVVEWNHACEAIFGHARAEVLGEPIGELIVPRDMREKHHEGFRRYIEGGVPRMLGRRIEVEALRAGGEVFPVELAVTEVRLPTRRLFTAHARDLTEARRADAEIVRQRDRIHQIEKLSAMGSLLAGVAHELNNPLAILMTQASLLKETSADEGVKKRAERIEAAASRSGRIVKSFLAMARQKPSEREPIGLNEVVRAALDMTAYGVRSAGITLERRLDADLPPVLGDRDMIGQVAANLVINAQQALADRPHPRRVTVATRREGAMAVLEVTDNGPGVPPAIRERIFEPYFTTKSVGVGTGIGLSICRQVAEEHDGRIEVEDAAGGGAVFRLVLPLSASHGGEAEAPTPGVEPARPGWSVLVVDDEVDVGQSLADILEFLGHRTELVGGPEEALARIAAGGRYDLIVADLRMPTMNGMELRAACTAMRADLAQRFVLMTGDVVAGPRLIEREGGPAPPTLEKPFNPAEVRALLERLSADGRL